MKKLRTVLCILAIAVVLSLCVFVTYGTNNQVAFADNGTTITEIEDETEVEQIADTAEVVEKETLLSRFQSYINNHLTEILAGTSATGVTVGISILIIWLKKILKKVLIEIATNTASTTNTTNSNAQMVETFNKMIALYNDIDNKLSATENNTQKQKDFALATLKIMQTVYANSKNVPQAIKDLVNISYVGAIKGDLGALQQATEALKGEVKNEIGGE